MQLFNYVFRAFMGGAIVVGSQTIAIAGLANPIQNDWLTQASPPNCDEPQTQLEMNACAAMYYETADEKLNEVYQELSSQMRSQLTDSQLIWIKFRDRNCEFASGLFEGGSIAPTIQNGCLGGMSEHRTVELQIYQSGQIPQPISRNYPEVDRRLNQVYQDFLDRLNAASQNRLQTAELAWIEFRDTNCAFEGRQVVNGENLCKIRMTEQRTEELSQLMDLTP